MIFKRRDTRPLLRTIAEFFWPRGGWRRASTYVLHRMRRLPDSPERICLGIAAGAFVSFLPLYGLHFLTAALVAWILRGNILAALLGTFYGNPITFPIMAVSALELGHWLLGTGAMVSFTEAMAAIGRASGELTHNLWALLTGGQVHWFRLQLFFWRVFLPYMIGGVIIGAPAAVAIYFLHLPLVRAYQRGRAKRLKARFEAARLRQRTREAGDET
ncbi:DUF2062 domain-containing protein [Pararhodobacter zhoushanensis]|uniref:DUF2062 domain-containing protein n=1 Tax=Pararhodobacter zhoushanensis TaxID=2479545 RepID=UPI000F8C9F1E|nr:DUF2062 domain-containing protein [Pararhodobacter zhoushanensis]